MKNFIFIVGGARSGKSRYAQDLAKRIGKEVAFIATCVPQDEEMQKRIALHRKSRPPHWKTIEEPKNLKLVLATLKNKFDVIIIDCLGLLISNFLSDGQKEATIEKEIESVARILSKAKFTTIVVSNEVGAGIVPDNPLARKFRDMLGVANQMMAEKATNVFLMQVGIPVKIKGGLKSAKIK